MGNVSAGELRVRFITVLGFLVGALAATSALAEGSRDSLLTLAPGASDILRTNPGARTIIIGNPAIVEANVVGEGVIAVTAKAAGSTNMILLDDKQAVILRTDVQVGPTSRGIQVLNGDKAQGYSCTSSCISVQTASGNSSGVATASGSFRNCDAARASGASSIRQGESGYASHLDADGDGIACEPPPRNRRTR
jgi:Flp pilus assembly secretin CpaC